MSSFELLPLLSVKINKRLRQDRKTSRLGQAKYENSENIKPINSFPICVKNVTKIVKKCQSVSYFHIESVIIICK